MCTGQVKQINIGGRNDIKIKYDPEPDVLLLVLRDVPPADAVEEPGGVIVNYGEDGEPVSVEFLNASVRRLIRSGELSVTLEAKSAFQALRSMWRHSVGEIWND